MRSSTWGVINTSYYFIRHSYLVMSIGKNVSKHIVEADDLGVQNIPCI